MASFANRKQKRRRNGCDSLEEILLKWKNHYEELNSSTEDVQVKKKRKIPVKRSRKGCMRGKGGPENSGCIYRGVRQRTWENWVAEIRACQQSLLVQLQAKRAELKKRRVRVIHGKLVLISKTKCSYSCGPSVTFTRR